MDVEICSITPETSAVIVTFQKLPNGVINPKTMSIKNLSLKDDLFCHNATTRSMAMGNL
tara:strand:- start:1644 stop:1820 length:177 start_codon:yes stop_codon:yes gene_type:complete